MFSIFSLIFFLIFITLFKPQIKANTYIENNDFSYLGNGIKFSNIKNHNFETIGIQIFNNKFKNDILKNINSRKYNYSRFEEKSFYKLSNYSKKFNTQLENINDFGINYIDVELNLAWMISEEFGSLYSKYLSSYFSVINAKNYELYAEINDYLNYN